MNKELKQTMHAQDASKAAAITLGAVLLNDQLFPQSPVSLILSSLNRHGLIAGATGSGKTKTIQALCEQLSLQGVPTFVMDIKGDLSGIAMPGEASEKLLQRNQSLGLSFTPRGFPVELLTLNAGAPGLPLRATVKDFGALLFSRMLDLNETQAGILTIVYELAKNIELGAVGSKQAQELPLVDLADLKAIFQYLQSEAGKTAVEEKFGLLSSASIGAILRKIIQLEAQGGDAFFGEPSFKVADLLASKINGEGMTEGVISILRLMDLQEKPKLFSTFMLKLLSDVFREFPEVGDLEKPKLVIFIDEAHLLFSQATKPLLELLNTTVKLIRSKGVSLVFCTQTPTDIPDAILSQLGFKIQHALRAFTAKDRQALKLVAQNFPPSQDYDTEKLLTALGIGEALVTSLDEAGEPTALVQCLVRAPESRMGVLTDLEVASLTSQSKLVAQYRQVKPTQPSAASLLKESQQLREKNLAEEEKITKGGSKSASTKAREDSMLTSLTKNTLFRQVVRQTFREILNTLFKLLGAKKR